jgi:protein-S-isoprenylcysteine O-methyltransferase Ste14
MLLAGDGAYRIRRHLTALPAPRDGAPLVADGSYGLARHPIYGGLVLGAAGLALARASAAGGLAAGVLAVFFVLKSAHEERMLAAVHPAYAQYRSQVRRRLIPWVL